MLHLIIIPPKDEGYYVTREPLDQMFDHESYNPYAAVCYATRLRDQFKEKVVILDAQANNLNTDLVKHIIKKLNPDRITYFLSAYSIPNDISCVDWHRETEFFISPFNIDLNELIKIYELPISKNSVIKYSEVRGRADFSFLDLNLYDNLRININDLCPFNCVMCCRSGTGNLPKPIDETIEEIEQIVKLTKRREIFLFGSEISLNADIAICLADKLLQKKLKLHLRVLDRVDLIEEDIYRELVKAGVMLTEIGVESGSQKCLDFIHKGITINDIINKFNILNKFETLSKKAFFMIGIPNEEWGDVLSSVKLVHTIKPDIISVDEFYPSLGSPIYKELKNKGMLYEIPWHFHKHPKRRILTFKHKLYKNYKELHRIKSATSFAMISGLLPEFFIKKNMRYCLRSLKNESIEFLKTFKPFLYPH
jgi:hypothetical protein